ncbi:hypothetical protein KR018_012634, partial [Drosophila ironensis]
TCNFKMHLSVVVCALLGFFVDPGSAEIEYNTINDDGSFQFRHANDDIGGYYHSASGTPDNTVRGRYGSRSPASGQIEETVYTAGPRGFRANGPKIHRKMDLAQYPVLPRGSPDDPLADPFDDPSYSFSFRTPDQSRSEENDSGNRIRGEGSKSVFLRSHFMYNFCAGLYSYLDDVGERHSVRYAAGAGTGFEISNAVPDSPSSVAYSSPLYKSHPKTRGKMSVQRGPAGSYKLIAAGPDHRRAESRAPDGLVRGTYSFLDDKGVQRTVEYIAGAGIGYRVVQNRIGPGTHINPSVADFRLADPDFRLANDFGRGAGGGLGPKTGSGGAGSGSGSGSGAGAGAGGGGSRGGGAVGGGSTRPFSRTGGRGSGGSKAQVDSDAEAAGNDLGSDDDNREDDIGLSQGSSGSTTFHGKEDRRGFPAGNANRGNTRYDGGSSDRRAGSTNRISGSGSRNRNKFSGAGSSERGGSGGRGGSAGNGRGGGAASSSSSSGEGGSGLGYLPPSSGGGGSGGGSAISGPGDNYHLNDDDVGSSLPPLVTANHRILEIDRDREWVQRHRDSTVIKNVGKWYVGLPPGQSVRAHVQNIDIIPLGGRIGLSPSEALRQDEIAELSASREH